MSREKFEQDIKARFGDSIDYRVCKNSDGEYMAWDMQVAWWAWQAASKASEQQLAAVVAENAGLKAENDQALQCMAEFRINLSMYKKFKYQSDVKTPATDAYLAEVRAQGVESGINTVIAMMNHQHPATSQAIDILQTHAAQLRKGAAL